MRMALLYASGKLVFLTFFFHAFDGICLIEKKERDESEGIKTRSFRVLAESRD